MSTLQKLILALLANPQDTSFVTIRKLLERNGYKLTNRRGSHVHFSKSSAPSFTFPVHKGKVQKWYVKDLLKELGHYSIK